MVKHIKLSILMLLFFAASAQSQSLDSLMEMALKTHPSLKVADLKIKQQELLKNSGFELKPTDFYYIGQALGYANDNRQHDFGVSQSFELPKVYRAKNALIEAESELLKQEKVLTEVELKKMVAQYYWEVVATYQQQQVYSNLDTFYNGFIKLAALRVETGETNKLELLRVESSVKNWQIKKNEADKRYELAQRQLGYLLGRDGQINIENVQFQQLSIDLPEVNAANHPLVKYYEQQKNVAAKQVQIEENVLSPTFNVGYASQIFDGNAGLNLVQFGVGIPLHKKPQKQRIQAAKAEAAIIASQAETDQFLLENEWNWNLAKLETINGQIFSIDRLLMDNLLESIGLAKIGYEGGELPYFEYLAIIESVIAAEIEKISLTQEYNEVVILINYALGVQ
ncbi:MAG: cobalt-zinc-cadmium resistance protein CzcA [Cognaticolwellia sp.]|jgi:cobalt-zinc-cadmium resistance protein CzcA|tara:strand:- start:112 stop:1302 length:1191 start_codon:yes stop_codon:yes gene_type:complete